MIYEFEVYYTLVTSLLSMVMTKTSINGVLSRGSMHLFSFNQLQEFLGISAEWISYDKKVMVFVGFHFFITAHPNFMQNLTPSRIFSIGFIIFKL